MRVISMGYFKRGGRPSSRVGLFEGLHSILELVDKELKRHWCEACGGLEVEMLDKIGEQVQFRIVKGRKGRD